MKCSNCNEVALFVYDTPSAAAQPYCNTHLPRFLRAAAQRGTLPTTEAYAEAQAAVLEKLSVPSKRKTKAAAVVTEPVEEVVVPTVEEVLDEPMPEEE